jgi:FkbM family methyltransferase
MNITNIRYKMETDLDHGWHVLKGDHTLTRAMKKERITEASDYQKRQLDVAYRYCNQFRHAIDVGANYGIMSYNMSKKFQKVSAFEIVPEVLECFKLNSEKFDLKNVDIYECGLGNKDETVSLHFDPAKTFSTHVDTTTTGNVNVNRLDYYNFTDVDFIKIDAEGFESFIVEGGLETIQKYKPVILYERKGHSKRYNKPNSIVLDILGPLGYTDLAPIDRKNGLIGVV